MVVCVYGETYVGVYVVLCVYGETYVSVYVSVCVHGETYVGVYETVSVYGGTHVLTVNLQEETVTPLQSGTVMLLTIRL